MALILTAIAVAMACGIVLIWMKRNKSRNELEQHSISVEQLKAIMDSRQTIFLFDVRQSLDLLAYPELIPGARRIPPDEVEASSLPRDEDVVVYCTCPGEKTSRIVLRRALELGFSRVKFLTGGLAAWKNKGYPVEPYRESFRLSVPTVARDSR